MKTFTRLTLLAVGLAAALPLVNAADTTPTPAPKHARLKAFLAHRQALRHHIAKRLDLSADQISRLKAERAKTAAAVKAIRADTSLTPEQKREKIRTTVMTARTEARGVLTPEQQAKAKHLRERLRRWRGGK